jgi:hypothetical protein
VTELAFLRNRSINKLNAVRDTPLEGVELLYVRLRDDRHGTH